MSLDFDDREFKDKKIVLEKLVRGCKNCSLCYETNYNPVPPVLNESSFALFIGRSPNKTEAQNE